MEILLYPFDLVISGDRARVSRAQAIVSEGLARTKAYMTWSHAGNAVEGRLKRLWVRVERELPDTLTEARVQAGPSADIMAEVAAIVAELRAACLSYEEWEALLRQALMVERDLLRRLLRSSPDAMTVPGAREFAAPQTGQS